MNDREPWKCQACGWTNVGYVSECDGCGERKTTATLSRSDLLAEVELLRTRGGIARSLIPAAKVATFHERCEALNVRKPPKAPTPLPPMQRNQGVIGGGKPRRAEVSRKSTTNEGDTNA